MVTYSHRLVLIALEEGTACLGSNCIIYLDMNMRPLTIWTNGALLNYRILECSTYYRTAFLRIVPITNNTTAIKTKLINIIASMFAFNTRLSLQFVKST